MFIFLNKEKMSNQKQNLISKELDENIQVYDNDEAYIFGEMPINQNKEISQENDNINNIYEEGITNNLLFTDNNQTLNNKEILNKLDLKNKIYKENKKDNNNNIYNTTDININNFNKINNLNQNVKNININNNIQDITFNKKYSINDIDSDKENIHKDMKALKNQDEKNEINIKNNDINNNEDFENSEETNESNIPLITLNFLSICQCCKDPFNSTDCIPYLFKCGHFFCKKCILEQFIDDEGIKCPNDGLVAKSISELKILNNFITDKTVSQRVNNSSNIYCNIHKGQKMTHYIEETKDFICIYCAFEKFKQNPNLEIKEINDKIKEIEDEIDIIIEENQKNIGIIKNTLNEIKKNKEIEEKKVIEVFDRLFEIIKEKKEENLNKINTLFKENAKKLSQKLESFSSKIEKGEEIKEKISLNKEKKEQSKLPNILKDYNNLISKINDSHYYKLILQKYKFIYEDESIIVRLINKFGDFKIIPNNCLFHGNKKNNNEINIASNSNINNNNFKKSLNYNHSSTKLNINKSYSNISPFQKNKNKINNISNNHYNSFYKQKMINSNINENNSNINNVNIYNNYKNNTRIKDSKKNKKLNNTIDFDNNISKNKNYNINKSSIGLRVNTPSALIKKNRLITDIYSVNKFEFLNITPNNKEKKSGKIVVNQNYCKNILNKGKNNKK